MIRRQSISKLLWMLSTVSSCYRAVSAQCSVSLRERTDFTIWILEKMRENVVPASWLAVIGLLDDSEINGKSVDSSSELTITPSGVFSL